MALIIKNTRDLRNEKFRLKMLVYSIGGVGKTKFCGTAKNAVVAPCETGHGKGLLTLADDTKQNDVDYADIKTYGDLEQFCSGTGLDAYDTLIVDGMSYFTDTIIKDHALSVPRQRGNTPKRQMGVAELDDYQVMAELERRLLARILSLDKNVIVTCLQDYYQPASGGDNPKPEKIGGPDLPGMMRLGAVAMFDVVLRLFLKSSLKDPKDAHSRYNARIWQTEATEQYLAKSRLRNGSTNIFPAEVPFDLEKGIGTFEWFLAEAKRGMESKAAEATQ